MWIAGSLAFAITLGSMVLAAIPPGGENKVLFEAKLIACTVGFVGIGLLLYWSGARKKEWGRDAPAFPAVMLADCSAGFQHPAPFCSLEY